ncbi:hypothetical protein M409DRAFT_20900 [Zasmidium cellare ATCC 36951]|uniref:Uncharacterized protein n=1 Tax=Zasmidium cellare ATCC 36951 TaxID=1080233 RepID=A0A6A6CTT1_ZASCE|nr:uncharacterized protein M409DRAFT_20900 [Zasmidium cellare ATCC 36951]KAF2168886.1 hypothetical protein M409DRAFT_20900 [Zasmidium cellare ATCC 36951]
MATKHLGTLEIQPPRGRPQLRPDSRPSTPTLNTTRPPRTYSPAPPSPINRPQTPDVVRRIVRNAEGRFEEGNVVEDFVVRHPRPRIGGDGEGDLDAERPRTPRSERRGSSSSRPGSSSSSMRSGFSKTFSWGRKSSVKGMFSSDSASPPPTPEHKQKRSRGRRGSGASASSIKDAFTRVTTELSRGKDIVSLNSHDRRRWMVDEKARIERESVATARQQREDWEAVRAQSRADREARRREREARRNALPPLYSTHTPPPPRQDHPRPDPIERTAIAVSKLTDWAKKRRGSEDSGLSFADCAPEGELESCGRCGREVTGKGALTKGLCGGCWGRRVDEFWESSSHIPDGEEDSTYSSNDSTRPSSPSVPREVNEEEYMKIARVRRIRRIRRTIYSDPGNPFAFGDDDDPHAAPTTLFQRSRDVSPAPTAVGDRPRVELNDSPASMIEESAGVLSDSPMSPPEEGGKFEHVRDSLLYAPTARRSGTPALITQLSIPASPASPQPPVKDEKFLVPKTIPRKRSLSWGGPESPQLGGLVSPEQDGNVRNTMYYGFYDQVLQEYHRSREGLAGVDRQD